MQLLVFNEHKQYERGNVYKTVSLFQIILKIDIIPTNIHEIIQENDSRLPKVHSQHFLID